MLRFAIGLLLIPLMWSCIKKPDTGPIPELEFIEFRKVGPSGYDSASFKLGYVDNDGDLFRDRSDQGPNLIFKTYAYDADSAKYTPNLLFSRIILQPADGYYKGKSIEGYIYLNEAEFRTPSKPKNLKFEVYMIDMQGNRSNTATLTYTLSN